MVQDPNYLPLGCITASALYSLAAALNRLHSWHRSHGGQMKDEPCLRLISWDEASKKTTAIVTSGKLHWDLIYKNGEWMFKSEALKEDV